MPDTDIVLNSEAKKVKKAVEFQGCAFHEGPCQPPDGIHPFTKAPNYESYADTKQRTNELSRLDIVVVEVWECRLRAAIAADEALGVAFSSFIRKVPFQYRDAFLGGRTEAVVRYYQACECAVRPISDICHACKKHRQRLLYLDKTSLYPYVNATQKYPVGHPLKPLNVPVEELFKYFGIAQVEILTPRNMAASRVADSKWEWPPYFQLVPFMCRENLPWRVPTRRWSNAVFYVYVSDSGKQSVEHGYRNQVKSSKKFTKCIIRLERHARCLASTWKSSLKKSWRLVASTMKCVSASALTRSPSDSTIARTVKSIAVLKSNSTKIVKKPALKLVVA